MSLAAGSAPDGYEATHFQVDAHLEVQLIVTGTTARIVVIEETIEKAIDDGLPRKYTLDVFKAKAGRRSSARLRAVREGGVDALDRPQLWLRMCDPSMLCPMATSGPHHEFIRNMQDACAACATAACRLDTPRFREINEAIGRIARDIDRSFSGSWLGYHAHVYLNELRSRRAGDHFDIQWGLGEAFGTTTTAGWREHTDAEVRKAILTRAQISETDLTDLSVVAREVEGVARAERARVVPVLHAIQEIERSPRLATILEELEKLELRHSANEFLSARRPEQVATNDRRAESSQRFENPPHLVTWFLVVEQMSVRLQCERLRDLLGQAAGLVEAKSMLRHPAQGPTKDNPMTADPKKVFVVHGRNVAARNAMHGFLRALGLKPLEWEALIVQTRSASPYNAEIVEEAFRTAQAVVVLFTGDDWAKLDDSLLADGEQPEELGRQPRPNVLIEAGMAIQRDRSRTIIVRANMTRHPSDFDGLNAVVYGEDDKFRNTMRGRLMAARCDVEDTGHDWLSAGDFKNSLGALLPTGLLPI